MRHLSQSPQRLVSQGRHPPLLQVRSWGSERVSHPSEGTRLALRTEIQTWAALSTKLCHSAPEQYGKGWSRPEARVLTAGPL